MNTTFIKYNTKELMYSKDLHFNTLSSKENIFFKDMLKYTKW